MTDPLSISIRPLTEADQPFLWEMLYQALYVPTGADAFPRDMVKRPEIARYAQDWGKRDDMGFAAVDDTRQRPVGAVWIRLLRGANKGYGYVDDMTPELSIAVIPKYRGRRIGTRLLEHLLKNARFRAVSLSISSDNPAVRLYQRLGFVTIETSGDSLTMVKIIISTDIRPDIRLYI